MLRRWLGTSRAPSRRQGFCLHRGESGAAKHIRPAHHTRVQFYREFAVCFLDFQLRGRGRHLERVIVRRVYHHGGKYEESIGKVREEKSGQVFELSVMARRPCINVVVFLAPRLQRDRRRDRLRTSHTGRRHPDYAPGAHSMSDQHRAEVHHVCCITNMSVKMVYL